MNSATKVSPAPGSPLPRIREPNNLLRRSRAFEWRGRTANRHRRFARIGVGFSLGNIVEKQVRVLICARTQEDVDAP